MTAAVMLEGHLEATRRRIEAAAGEFVLIAQDTTYYNYSSHRAMDGLGKIQGNLLGIMQHNLLALSETGLPLGLLGQQYWSRDSGHAYPGTESERWFRGLETVNREMGNAGRKAVLMQDREADIYEFFQAARAPGVELLVRVHEPRRLEIVADEEVCKLEEAEARLPIVGRRSITILRGGREVTLEIELQGGRVNVLAGKHNRLARAPKTEGLSLVIARERAAFDRQGRLIESQDGPAVWYLLTSLPAEDFAQIAQIVTFYALRWRIERFHYTLKSGALEVEKLQFDDLQTMINGLAFYSITAWQILALVYLLREEAEQPADRCFEEKELKILEAMSGKKVKTVKQAALTLAKLAGFAPSKKQPLPGVKVLAQSLERFYYIKLGFDARPG